MAVFLIATFALGVAGCSTETPDKVAPSSSEPGRSAMLPLSTENKPPAVRFEDSGLEIPPLHTGWTDEAGDYVQTPVPAVEDAPLVLWEESGSALVVASGAPYHGMDVTVYETPAPGRMPTNPIRQFNCNADDGECRVVLSADSTTVSLPALERGSLVVLKVMYPGPDAESPANVASWGFRVR